MSLRVRPAVLDDIPRMCEMAEAFIGSIDDPAVEFDGPGFATRMATYLQIPDFFVRVIDDGELGAVGGIGAFAGPHYLFVRPRMASEMFWWVEPDYRGGTAALRLIEAYEAWARDQGCEVVCFSAFVDDPRVARLLDRRGYRHMESAYSKRLVDRRGRRLDPLPGLPVLAEA